VFLGVFVCLGLSVLVVFGLIGGVGFGLFCDFSAWLVVLVFGKCWRWVV